MSSGEQGYSLDTLPLTGFGLGDIVLLGIVLAVIGAGLFISFNRQAV